MKPMLLAGDPAHRRGGRSGDGQPANPAPAPSRLDRRRDPAARIRGAQASQEKPRRGERSSAETVAAAIRSKQIVSLMGVAANRGDASALLQLFTKLDGRSWAATGPNAYPSYEISQALHGGHGQHGRRPGRWRDVARLVDGFLDSNRRRSQAARHARPTRPRVGDPIGSQAYLRRRPSPHALDGIPRADRLPRPGCAARPSATRSCSTIGLNGSTT